MTIAELKKEVVIWSLKREFVLEEEAAEDFSVLSFHL